MKRIDAFDFPVGKVLQRKFEVLQLLGKGWEGEVYLVREIATGIERAVKFFYPHRNAKQKTSKFYAQKLHKLRHCSMVIHYHGQETITIRGHAVTYLVSELIEGKMLSEFLQNQPGKRLQPFVALHLLYALCKGVEQVHALREYHGDLHSDNIIVERFGLGFSLKVFDLYKGRNGIALNQQDDLVDVISVFYECLGGQKFYAKMPVAIKNICCGLKHSLMVKKFKNIRGLREHLERLEW